MPQQTMSPTTRVKRAARVATVICAVCCAVALPIGVATAVVGSVHLFTATKQPTADKTAQFKQGNTVLFNTPQLLAWRNRLLMAGVPATAAMLATGGVMFLLRRASSAERPAA